MRRGYLAPTALGFALVITSACSGSGAPGITSPKVNIASVEQNSFTLVNKERSVVPTTDELTRSELVARVAREYSEQMRDQGFFAHASPDGKELEHRLRSAGVQFMSAAENLARVTTHADPATFAHTILMQQPYHRENILGPDYKLLGVGAAKEGDTVWITQIFIRD